MQLYLHNCAYLSLGMTLLISLPVPLLRASVDVTAFLFVESLLFDLLLFAVAIFVSLLPSVAPIGVVMRHFCTLYRVWDDEHSVLGIYSLSLSHWKLFGCLTFVFVFMSAMDRCVYFAFNFVPA